MSKNSKNPRMTYYFGSDSKVRIRRTLYCTMKQQNWHDSDNMVKFRSCYIEWSEVSLKLNTYYIVCYLALDSYSSTQLKAIKTTAIWSCVQATIRANPHLTFEYWNPNCMSLFRSWHIWWFYMCTMWRICLCIVSQVLCKHQCWSCAFSSHTHPCHTTIYVGLQKGHDPAKFIILVSWIRTHTSESQLCMTLMLTLPTRHRYTKNNRC